MQRRVMSGLSRVVLGAVLLVGCGGRAQSDGRGALAGAGSGNEVAGAAGAAPAAAGGEAGVGAAGEPGVALSTLDISGRWGLFTFEDPVGVQLFQNDGVLSGSGCDVGARPDNADVAENLCGSIGGLAQRNRAQFDFHFGDSQDIYYAADVTISADATRMTGLFHGTSAWLEYPLAWLRIPDGDEWLNRTRGDEQTPGGDRYELQVQEADAGEYSAQRSYRLDYVLGGLSGDLGSFFNTEMQRVSSAGPLVVGPVAVTDPTLPISLSIELDGKRFTRVSAVTGTGHHYTFSATTVTN